MACCLPYQCYAGGIVPGLRSPRDLALESLRSIVLIKSFPKTLVPTSFPKSSLRVQPRADSLSVLVFRSSSKIKLRSELHPFKDRIGVTNLRARVVFSTSRFWRRHISDKVNGDAHPFGACAGQRHFSERRVFQPSGRCGSYP